MSCGWRLLNRQCGSTAHWDQCLPVAPGTPQKLTPCRRACPSRQVNKPTDENHMTSHQTQLWIFRLEIRWQRSKVATSLTHHLHDHPVGISEMNAVVLSDYWLTWTSFSSSYLHCSLLQLSKQFNNTQFRLIDWVNVLRPTWHKIGHFGDALPSQLLGTVLKKLNVTQQKQTTQKQSKLVRV